MPRYRLTLEYDGTPFVGWQMQDNGLSVQAVLEDALGRLDGRPVRIHGAGRTDTGVHATGQVAHVDLAKARPADVIRDAVNA
ncbi:tRNA pseudouridine(38-40) synthase TruA, partial [Mycobacterium tuberculosis]|nr:tRNA pseudouridine(38-40) synthase TruA [Mycobacterium tuberculosis]MBP0651028.1 tRNA pseudouridine(38-40) synthase TruA [Mycobacterium tuberculosis]